MDRSVRLDALDFVLDVLKEHEMALDDLANRLEALVDQLDRLAGRVDARRKTMQRYYQRE